MVKDPTKVKPKFIGSFTKRQVVCYGLAAAIGIPFYLLVKDTIGKETAALFMVALMFPFIIASMYEKDGLPAERYFYRYSASRLAGEFRSFSSACCSFPLCLLG